MTRYNRARKDGDLELLTAALTATAASWAVVRGTQNVFRRRAVGVRLAQLEVALPLEVDHLPPCLQSLVCGARATRRVLETPLSRVLSAGSWRYTDFDLAVTEARRTLWDWMCGLQGLGAADYALLRELRLDPRPLRGLLYAPGVFERGEDVFAAALPAPDVEHVVESLCTAIEHLRRFEIALLSYRPDPYR
ncbi:MAG: hypothetical protein KUG77_01955 [Nannocystaceae bacterium]|nr:hypothetical protein [Nannocystaceae bacterium]